MDEKEKTIYLNNLILIRNKKIELLEEYILNQDSIIESQKKEIAILLSLIEELKNK